MKSESENSYYLKVPQGSFGIITSRTPSNIKGIFTQGLHICRLFGMIDGEGGKAMLAHLDAITDLEGNSNNFDSLFDKMIAGDATSLPRIKLIIDKQSESSEDGIYYEKMERIKGLFNNRIHRKGGDDNINNRSIYVESIGNAIAIDRNTMTILDEIGREVTSPSLQPPESVVISRNIASYFRNETEVSGRNLICYFDGRDYLDRPLDAYLEASGRDKEELKTDIDREKSAKSTKITKFW